MNAKINVSEYEYLFNLSKKFKEERIKLPIKQEEKIYKIISPM